MIKVPKVPPLSKEKIELRAEMLLKRFDPDGLSGKRDVDIERIFEMDIETLPDLRGLKTGAWDLSAWGCPAGTFGCTDAAEKVSWIDNEVYKQTGTVGRRFLRSTMGHETGHCILHVPSLQLFKSLFNHGPLYRPRQALKAYEDPEWQAFGFSGALLMPRGVAKKMFQAGASLEHMADFFDVNPAFVRSRMKFLGLMKNPF